MKASALRRGGIDMDRVWIWFAENGNIRKWQSTPFQDGVEYRRAAQPAVKALTWIPDHGVAALGPYRLFQAETPLGRFCYGTDAEGAAYWQNNKTGVFMVGDEQTARRQAEAAWTKAACAEASKFVALSALVSAPADPAPAPAENVDAHPLAKFGSEQVAPLGLYRVHWKSGGSSLAAIGMMENGDRWIAPTNWVRPTTMPSAGKWGEIERLEPIDADLNGQPLPAPADVVSASERLLDALQRYGFPVSDAAVRALVDGGSREAQSVHVAAVQLRTALRAAPAGDVVEALRDALELARLYVADDIKRGPIDYSPRKDLVRIDAALERARTALRAQGWRTPDGWKLVPVEPVPEMIGAWYRYKSGHHYPGEEPPRDTSDYGAYRAMIAAAPTAQGGA